MRNVFGFQDIYENNGKEEEVLCRSYFFRTLIAWCFLGFTSLSVALQLVAMLVEGIF